MGFVFQCERLYLFCIEVMDWICISFWELIMGCGVGGLLGVWGEFRGNLTLDFGGRIRSWGFSMIS